MEFLSDNFGALIVFLLAVSEFLALFPGMKSNGIFDFVVNLLKQLEGKEDKKS